MNEPLSFALIERDCKRIGRLHAQKYADWIREHCVRWKIPWRPEYAVPVDEQSPADRRGPSRERIEG